MAITIPLGSEACVAQLFSFPNAAALPWTLAETVKHWFDLTLARDGMAAQGAQATVIIGPSGYLLALDGPPALRPQLMQYAARVPRFLDNGWQALTTVVPKLKAFGRWDASPDAPAPGSPPYLPWRFFLPHGMAMLNQKALLFFHYPPIRLLETNQDYLDDPVPVRWEELLTANGVAAGDLPLFNRVMDATPIGAEDDQGSKALPDGTPVVDPIWGAIPIQFFHEYQRAQVSLLLNVSSAHPGYTVPVVVFGAHPLATFNTLYGLALSNNQAAVAEIVPGQKTPVLAATHPYVFYGRAQGFDAIGSGKLIDVTSATAQMISDLAVAYWLKRMTDDSNQDPHTALAASQQYWKDPAQAATVGALVQHQGSLKYSDPTTLAFQFLVPLALPSSPASSGAAAAPQLPSVPAGTSDAAPATAPAARTASGRPAASAAVGAAPAVPSPASAVSPPASVASSPAPGSLAAIGDGGKPVDWWFVYKVAASKTATPPARPAVGDEYLYFDSDMAQTAGLRPVLSPHRIRDAQSALFATIGQLSSDAAKANRSLGWFCYDDEDRLDGRGEGQGPPWDCGHCKGVLAFDLATNSGFWLVHSVPLFPWPPAWQYRDGELMMGQTMLCITLADAETAQNIAQLMYDAHSPNVYLASDLLAKTAGQLYGFAPAEIPLTDVPTRLAPTDARLQLMKNMNAAKNGSTAPYAGQVRFLSRGGQPFMAIAKNKAWGKDFYDDLVGSLLNEDIDVETWERTKAIPPSEETGETHKVVNMQGVNLAPLGIQYAWPEFNDHAKLAISDPDAPQAARWVCVGDINDTDAQEKRGGGTVAFQCDPLWNSLSQVLSATPMPAGAAGTAAHPTATAGALPPAPAATVHPTIAAGATATGGGSRAQAAGASSRTPDGRGRAASSAATPVAPPAVPARERALQRGKGRVAAGAAKAAASVKKFVAHARPRKAKSATPRRGR